MGYARRGLRRLPSRWAPRQAGALLGLTGIVLLITAAYPPSPSTPVAVDVAVGLGLLLWAVVAVTAAPAWGPVGLEISIMGLAVAVGAITVSAASELGHVGPLVVLVAAIPIVAEVLPRGAAWRQLILALLVWTGALQSATSHHDADDYLLALGWVVVPLTTLVCVRMVDRLNSLALTDPLTGVLNRNGLEMQAALGRAVAKRSELPTTVVAIDLDRFKAFNDKHGHPAGDRMLRELTAGWGDQLRDSDCVARTGGDEFVLVLPGTSVVESAAILERMSAKAPSPWTAGAVEWQDGEDVFRAIERADEVLYRRKLGMPESDVSNA